MNVLVAGGNDSGYQKNPVSGGFKKRDEER